MKDFMFIFYVVAVLFFISAAVIAFTMDNFIAVLVCSIIASIAYRTPRALRQQRHGAGE